MNEATATTTRIVPVFGVHSWCGHPRQIDDGEVLDCAQCWSNGRTLRIYHPADRPPPVFAFEMDRAVGLERKIRQYELADTRSGELVRPFTWRLA